METKSAWHLAFKYGLILSFTHIAVNLIAYIINPDGVAKGGASAMGIAQFVILTVASVLILRHGTIKRRDEEMGGYINYGQSFGFMIKIGLPAAFVISVYTFVFFTFLAPDLMAKTFELQAQQMYDKGMSEEQIDQAMQMGKKFSSPTVLTLFGLLGSLFQIGIFALIAAIFTRKNSPADDIQ